MKYSFYFPMIFICTTLSACNANTGALPQDTSSSRSDSPSLLKVENLINEQTITENVPTQFRITAAPSIVGVSISANGHALGSATYSPDAKQFRFSTTFKAPGDQDLTFAGFGSGPGPLSTSSFRVHIVAKETPAATRYFNAYVLKAVDYLDKNYGLLGYNINKQNTHDIEYSKYGTLKPTGGGLTMCVAGSLEVILTAFDIYAKETGNNSIFDFLPFSSWSTLDPSSIKAQIWVDPKLNSSGTADAITHFGLGERVKFKDLEPGGFININRTTGSGHSVTFLSFIDIKGNDVPQYNDTVVGFRYFGAQGHAAKGEGGLSYRHAFFSQFGCPDVPYQRDCNVILSDNPNLLNVGEILDPKDWKHTSVQNTEHATAATAGAHLPLTFNGLTTDD